MLDMPIRINGLELKNRLVMPPMHSGLAAEGGHVTEALAEYYAARTKYSAPGLVIMEHTCITEAGRASHTQLSISDDSRIDGHKRLTDAIHEAGGRVILQLNHAGAGAQPLEPCDRVSASAISLPLKKLDRGVARALTKDEILYLQEQYVLAARRAMRAGYDGVEIHSAHGYLLDQFYSPLTNHREDEYGPQSIENRTRFLREAFAAVRSELGDAVPMAVRLGGADYLPGGATEEDAVEACRLLEAAGVDLLDLSGGMCSFDRPDHPEPGYFGSMTEKIKAAVQVPVLLTGGVKTVADAERLLTEGKADLIGVGRALFKDAHWRENN